MILNNLAILQMLALDSHMPSSLDIFIQHLVAIETAQESYTPLLFERVMMVHDMIRGGSMDGYETDIRIIFPEKRLSAVRDKITDILSRDEIYKAKDYLSDRSPLPVGTPPRITLIQDEIASLKKSIKDLEQHSACFVGAGPMPTSALGLIDAGFKKITCIDRDSEAVQLGKDVLNKYKAHHVQYIEAKAKDYDYSQCDIVWIANFVVDKQGTVEKIVADRYNKKTIILMRDALGMRSFINYPLDFTSFDALKSLKQLFVTPVSDTRINNTVAYQAF